MTNKQPSPNMFAIIFLSVLFVFFALFLDYSWVTLLVSVVLYSVGALIPYKSTYLTWWLYTLGGKLPLPDEHVWLLEELNISGKTMGRNETLVLAVISSQVGLILYNTVFRNSVDLMLVSMSFVVYLVLFGMGLTLSTAVVRKRVLSKP